MVAVLADIAAEFLAEGDRQGVLAERAPDHRRVPVTLGNLEELEFDIPQVLDHLENRFAHLEHGRAVVKINGGCAIMKIVGALLIQCPPEDVEESHHAMADNGVFGINLVLRYVFRHSGGRDRIGR